MTTGRINQLVGLFVARARRLSTAAPDSPLCSELRDAAQWRCRSSPSVAHAHPLVRQIPLRATSVKRRTQHRPAVLSRGGAARPPTSARLGIGRRLLKAAPGVLDCCLRLGRGRTGRRHRTDRLTSEHVTMYTRVMSCCLCSAKADDSVRLNEPIGTSRGLARRLRGRLLAGSEVRPSVECSELARCVSTTLNTGVSGGEDGALLRLYSSSRTTVWPAQGAVT